jgi:hypothetical protein
LPSPLTWIVGLRERRDYSIGVSAELGDHADPALRASTTEVPFASRSGIRFTVIRRLDRCHRLLKILAHLDMLVENMIPRYLLHLDEMPLGVAGLGYGTGIGYEPRLGLHPDEDRL